jgi:hypothetical protein
LIVSSAELRRRNGATAKNRFTAKDAKAAEKNQNLNHKGTRREAQGHEGKKAKKFFGGKQDFQGWLAEDWFWPVKFA